jgi:chromosome segregation ATPase
MPDETATTPEEQGNPPSTTDPSSPPSQQAPASPETNDPGNWEARYKGSVSKIQELTLSNRQLTQQLEAKNSEIEQLKSRLSVKDVEKDAALGERDKRLSDVLQENQQLQAEVNKLRSLERKLKIANEMGRPDLMKIANHIPDIEDEETLTTVMKDFAGWGESLAKEREKQLMAGVTLPTGPGNEQPTAPATNEAWEKKINGLPIGSTERLEALDAYGDWLERQHQSR